MGLFLLFLEFCGLLIVFLVSVSIAGDPKSGDKRNYRKPDYCLFCKGRYMSKISSHYLAVHGNEQKVKEVMELPSGSTERKRLLALLQNEGNHVHNCEVRMQIFFIYLFLKSILTFAVIIFVNTFKLFYSS